MQGFTLARRRASLEGIRQNSANSELAEGGGGGVKGGKGAWDAELDVTT